MDESRRLLLRGPGIVLAAGAHDALSAKLAEQAGFDAIWAGGFGISAVQAVPDANILTLTETLEAVRRIVDTVGIPVVADCDNGYGNAINVMRTAAEFERAGAAGICIEDNEFPKRCSFYAGVRRNLVPAEEHARKVEAATAARRDPGFLVIARTEALIAGLGQEEALGRARAYADAGADAVLVHSKAPDFNELHAFAEAWDRPVRWSRYRPPTPPSAPASSLRPASGWPSSPTRRCARQSSPCATRWGRCGARARRRASRSGSRRSRRSMLWSACRSSGRTSSASSSRATRRPAPSSWRPASSRSSCPSSRTARRRCSR